jgi:hypothetical protein
MQRGTTVIGPQRLHLFRCGAVTTGFLYNRGAMKVIVRNPKRRELDLPGNRQVRDVLTRDSHVRDEDTIEVISAISGGA